MYLQNLNNAEKIVIENLAKTIQPTRARERPLKQVASETSQSSVCSTHSNPQMLLS